MGRLCSSPGPGQGHVCRALAVPWVAVHAGLLQCGLLSRLTRCALPKSESLSPHSQAMLGSFCTSAESNKSRRELHGQLRHQHLHML